MKDIKKDKKDKYKLLTKTSGITLIALIITIVILLILAGISISSLTNSGLFGRAKEATFKSKMSEYKEKANMYIYWQISKTMNTDTSKINSGEILKSIIEEEMITDITKEDVSIDITEILEDINKEEKEYLVIYKGELCYVSNDKIKDNSQQEQWCREIGIKILEYAKLTGIVVRNGNYELVNGVYVCTPKLDEGFVKEKTRYLEFGSNGYLTPGNWVTDKPTQSWYDYKNAKWANIYVENNGSDVYYIWIPRYCFKLDQDKQRSDVKFIDIDNNYKDENGNAIKWESEDGIKGLKEQGYQVPEAFTFNGEPIPGYWAMKYTVGDTITPSIINYDMSVMQGQVTIKNITLNTTITNANPITKYTIALNGRVVEEITASDRIANINSEIIKFSNLKQGNNTINVTGLNANGEVVGSMTKEYAPVVVNQPKLRAEDGAAYFNEETTFYVTYDENGVEHSTIPISKEMPKYWYEYGESRWANIVTRNNGLEIYYVWIPRYEFYLDQTNQRSIVKFIQGTSTKTTQGYQIPEAFTYNGEQITGYWAMKYTVGEETTPILDTEVVATSSTIRTKGIVGAQVADGQVYKYYINGEYKGETTAATDSFEYSKLQSNTKYTILVEIRNSSTNAYVGTIVKQISTIDANKPVFAAKDETTGELEGFNPDNTYYVLYDEQFNMTIGSKIELDGSNMPLDPSRNDGLIWYDYSQSRWANIVVTDGTVEDGQITGAKHTTYYTWIPRYEFMITSGQQAQPASGRTEVRFVTIDITNANCTTGYQVPEAFTFDGKEIQGYWAMKYTVGE